MTKSKPASFETEFLSRYLTFGLGAMPKSEIDALVMSLLDKYGFDDRGPLASLSNQAVSEKLKTPVTRVKKLRYEAALKFGGDVEQEARARLLAALWNASLEPDNNKICLIIEDALAKNWLQGQLKANAQIFDHSFNTEIIKVSPEGLFKVLDGLFHGQALDRFKNTFENQRKMDDATKRAEMFKDLAKSFAKGAAEGYGKGIFAVFKTLILV
jgi:hypothetical protein